MLSVLQPTFISTLQQIRMLQVAQLCWRKQKVVLLFATKSVQVENFTAPRQTFFAATDAAPMHGVTTA